MGSNLPVTSNILIGDSREGLRSLREKSVHCCVTSPPYFGLRNYGMDGQLGLEKTPTDYVAGMVEVFREVWRVLRDDGIAWLNIGDSYASSTKGDNRTKEEKLSSSKLNLNRDINKARSQHDIDGVRKVDCGLAAKQLLGIPWRLAFALQEDGWYLRSEIIWRKPAPMPESVTDRPTKSHEQVFLLAKSERYFYDAVAIAEAGVAGKNRGGNVKMKTEGEGAVLGRATNPNGGLGETWQPVGTRNKRSVWTISTRSFKGAHFACFPPDLVEPCILAGTSAHGCCSECGSPWNRITNRKKLKRDRLNDFTKRTGEDGTGNSCSNSVAGVSVETLGWEPTCSCSAEVVPCTVLDPFSGSGTTGAVANVLGRNYVGTELNPEYAAMWEMRLADVRKWWDKKNGKKPKKRKVVSAKQGDLFFGD